mgnify:CR=1 FL=1
MQKESHYTIHYFQKDIKTDDFTDFVLGADVGGTTTNIAIAGINEGKPELLFTLDFQTKHISGFFPALKKTLTFAQKNHDITISDGCIGAAGVVSPDHTFVDLTNIAWNIDTGLLLKETAMRSLFILNDFQTLGYSLNTIDMANKKQVICIRNVDKENQAKTRVVLGAGTGMGKTVLHFDENDGFFHAYESEGGHTDLPIYTKDELELASWLKKQKHPEFPVYYEDFLSGSGLVNMFNFFCNGNQFPETVYTKEINETDQKAELISKYRRKDPCCKKTFQIFQRFFARCAKNLALDNLAGGGVFIAGGIAQKNSDIINSIDFINEFNQNHMRSDFLKEIPLYLLPEYYLSLSGACFVAANIEKIRKKQ